MFLPEVRARNRSRSEAAGPLIRWLIDTPEVASAAGVLSDTGPGFPLSTATRAYLSPVQSPLSQNPLVVLLAPVGFILLACISMLNFQMVLSGIVKGSAYLKGVKALKFMSPVVVTVADYMTKIFGPAHKFVPQPTHVMLWDSELATDAIQNLVRSENPPKRPAWDRDLGPGTRAHPGAHTKCLVWQGRKSAPAPPTPATLLLRFSPNIRAFIPFPSPCIILPFVPIFHLTHRPMLGSSTHLPSSFRIYSPAHSVKGGACPQPPSRMRIAFESLLLLMLIGLVQLQLVC
eukprot:gene19063-25667_t